MLGRMYAGPGTHLIMPVGTVVPLNKTIIQEESAMSTMAADRATRGYGLAHDEGEAFWVLGMLETIKIGSKDTAGKYGLIEVVARAGDGSPWHTHPDEDEWFYVVDGEFTFYVGDARLTLTAGSFAFGPKGVPHTFIAETQGATALIGFQPFLFEGFMREAGEPAAERVLPPALETPPDMKRLLPIASRNGMEILGPPGPPPGR
jgi:quercetin dioxygenase-like cupin family protein